MGLFGHSGGGNADANFGKEPPKSYTGDLPQTGRTSNVNPGIGMNGLSLDAVRAQGQRLRELRDAKLKTRETKQFPAAKFPGKEGVTRTPSALFSGSWRNSAPVKGEKGAGKAFVGDQKFRKVMGIENTDQAKGFAGGVLGKEMTKREDVINIGKAAYEKRWDKIKGLNERQVHTLKNNPEARKQFLRQVGGMVGGDYQKKWKI